MDQKLKTESKSSGVMEKQHDLSCVPSLWDVSYTGPMCSRLPLNGEILESKKRILFVFDLLVPHTSCS